MGGETAVSLVPWIDIGVVIRESVRVLMPFVSNPDAVAGTIAWYWQIFSFISLFVSALLLWGIIYAKIQFGRLAEHMAHVVHEEEEAYLRSVAGHGERNRWHEALAHSESNNPNDWRLAIIEADILLEEVLAHKAPGATTGERLKAMSRETMRTLDDAWTAHKVRNEVAHKGGDFILTKRLTTETLARYQRVFEEIGYGISEGDGHGSHH